MLNDRKNKGPELVNRSIQPTQGELVSHFTGAIRRDLISRSCRRGGRMALQDTGDSNRSATAQPSLPPRLKWLNDSLIPDDFDLEGSLTVLPGRGAEPGGPS